MAALRCHLEFKNRPLVDMCRKLPTLCNCIRGGAFHHRINNNNSRSVAPTMSSLFWPKSISNNEVGIERHFRGPFVETRKKWRNTKAYHGCHTSPIEIKATFSVKSPKRGNPTMVGFFFNKENNLWSFFLKDWSFFKRRNCGWPQSVRCVPPSWNKSYILLLLSVWNSCHLDLAHDT